MMAAVDVRQHAGQGAALTPLAMHAALSLSLHQTGPFPGQRHDSWQRFVSSEGKEWLLKSLDHRCEPGKQSGAWVKMRLNLGQEFVIGGFTTGTDGFDWLVVGVYEGEKVLYVARVRAGFVPASRRDVFARLKPLI